MNVSAWSIRNPIPAAMLFVLLTFGGLLSFQAMKVQNFPDIDLPTVTVSAALPGAALEALQREGHLMPIYMQLASLMQLKGLLERHARLNR